MRDFTWWLFSIVGGGVIIAFAAVHYTLKYYTTLKLILKDIFRWLGSISKWARKKSVSTELEGTLNGVIDSFNRNFENPVLPNCRIQWVTAENQSSTLIEDEVIVCLSFDKRDHNLNFYNATLNFLQKGLVSKVKPYVKQSTRAAIDQFSTKLVLKEYRREALSTFNQKFAELDADTKEMFFRLEDTDVDGLYNNFLLPEFHYLGELLSAKTPSRAIEVEIEQFLNWYYDLATREHDERTNLRYESANFKIGVILVAKMSTFQAQGIQAYTKWAEKYASESYNAVYILSKGQHRHNIATEVADNLKSSKGFDQINKNVVSKRFEPDGTKAFITCICLRPNPTTIRFNAWESIKKSYEAHKKVIGIVESTSKTEIVVNVSGLNVRIPSKDLSAASLPDASKIFKEDQELELDVIEFDASEELISLSNVGTKTDPKIIIEANLSSGKSISVVVAKVQKDKDGLDKGLVVKCNTPHLEVFIPRSKLTFSRYHDISKTYKPGDNLEITLGEFNYGYGNYVGSISSLSDPWTSDKTTALVVGDEVDVRVREIQERYVTCEIEEGLECRLYMNEISWNQEQCIPNIFQIDQMLRVKIVSIDLDLRKISVSIKRLHSSPQKIFFDTYADQIVDGIITGIDMDSGIWFKNVTLGIEGYVRWNELVWGPIYSIGAYFKIGQEISIRVFEYNEGYDSIGYSVKRCDIHQYDQFCSAFDGRDYVRGTITHYYGQIATVEVEYNGIVVQGYVHKSKISNCCYITDEDIPQFLPINSSFGFVVDRKDDQYQIVELDRKTFLSENREVDLGDTYSVYYVKSDRGKNYFYSDDLEGYLTTSSNRFVAGERIDVYAQNTTSNEFELS